MGRPGSNRLGLRVFLCGFYSGLELKKHSTLLGAPSLQTKNKSTYVCTGGTGNAHVEDGSKSHSQPNTTGDYRRCSLI